MNTPMTVWQMMPSFVFTLCVILAVFWAGWTMSERYHRKTEYRPCSACINGYKKWVGGRVRL